MAKAKKPEINKIVLAYSGGLDTSIILKWLKNEYGCKVVAFSADLGQGEELDPVREKALATGADKVYIDDLKEEFVRDFVFPCSAPMPSTKGTTCWAPPSPAR
jgi:argininosuccinate synthase